MNAPTRFDELASRCLEGALTPAEETEFLRLLDDPVQQRAFAELERINLELLASLAAPLPDAEMLRLVRKDAHGVSSSASSQRAVAVMERVQRPSVRHKAKTYRAQGSGWGLPIGIAALLALVLGVYAVMRPSKAPVEAIATLVSVKGSALRVVGGKQETLTAQMELVAGDTLQTNLSGEIEFAYPDGTRVAVNPGATMRLQPPGSIGKTIFVTSGVLTARVKPQPANAPMKLLSPHAEARVVGTELLLEVRRGSTRLDVTEGKVHMLALESKKSIDVDAGKYAVAAAGVPLAALDIKPIAVAATPAAPAPVWEPLFKNTDLSDWKITRGGARIENGMAIVESKPRREASRMESLKHYPALEIECDIRVSDTHLAEFQFEGYLWFFQIDLGPRHKSEWHTFKASIDGDTRQAWLDGQSLTLEHGEREGPASGSIAFYVSHRGKLEIRDAKIRVPSAPLEK